MFVIAEAIWSTWGSWSSCTKTCGRGRSDRYRTCSEGSTCPGDQSEAKWCNSNTCPGQSEMMSRNPKSKPSDPLCPIDNVHVQILCHHVGMMLLMWQFLMLFFPGIDKLYNSIFNLLLFRSLCFWATREAQKNKSTRCSLQKVGGWTPIHHLPAAAVLLRVFRIISKKLFNEKRIIR